MVDIDVQSDGEPFGEPSEAADDAIASTESYETDDGIVLFDGDNLLAWIQANSAVRLDDAA
ncbi:DUF7331 family protein [Halomarina litorea]|uniref:DUF7331 family protein n=1 Tax=Halomarina litorea TaxID=2961595 RepID=UPI0020C335DB|nr:hypothetical protein [Halomarina sp. BCD28]